MADWYIIDGDLPFLEDFPELPDPPINDAPLSVWRIVNGDLPYKLTFPDMPSIDDVPYSVWVIVDGEPPFKKTFPTMPLIDDVPYNIWAIRDGKPPYKRNFPQMYKCVGWQIGNEKEFWYIGSSPWGYQVRKAWARTPDEFILMEHLGPSIVHAALETDGLFEIDGESYLIHTEGIPWMFVVTNEGKLYAKKCLEDIHTAQLLATNVTKVAAVRGYKSTVFSIDKGITVAYLKTDGSAWMRTSDNDTFTHWTAEACLDFSPNINIQAFRLNDYHTAIYVEGVNRVFYD